MLSLDDVSTLIVDCEHKTAPKAESGFPLIRTPDIGRGRISHRSAQRVDEETYRAWTQRTVPVAGDLILAREAPVGNVGIVTENMNPCLGQRTVLIRPNPELVDPHFLNYLLNSPETQGAMMGLANGSTVAHLNMKDIRRLALPELPVIDVQRTVGRLLSSYDELIENNSRRIEILEEMAQAIYREWFVEFRYPGHEDVPLVDSELGPIPEGWEYVAFGDVVEIARSNIDPGKFPDETFAHFSLPAFDNNRSLSLDSGSTIKSHKFLITEPCVLYSKLNPKIPRVWFVDSVPENRAVASSEFLVITPRLPWTYSMVYSLCCSENFAGRVVGLAAGTSTSHQRAKPADLLRIHVALGPGKLISEFDKVVGPMLKLIGQLREQCLNLRETRDLLLPKLISGEIDVTDLNIELADSVA